MSTILPIATWCLAHQSELLALAAAVVALLRAIPAPTWRRFEAAHPRLAHLARALRKLAPDVIPAARAVVAALRHAPPSGDAPSSPQSRRPTTLPVPPEE